MFKKKILAAVTILAMSAVMVLPSMATDESTTSEIVIVHTNDTHCAIENGLGFEGVAAYVSDMEAIYGADNVTLVDAGDAVQGDSIGKLTEGEAIIDMMNAVGYDYMAPGNHEFDYKVDQFLVLMDMFEGTVISSNFIDLSTGDAVYDAYGIEEYTIDGTTYKVAYVGITTPETLVSSSPTYFQDENGDYIYSFCQGNDGEDLYANVQASVDAALAEGADYVVAIGHLGIEEEASPYTSIEVIENTTGIDVMIDGHSHSEIIGQEVWNEEGDVVILNQAGEKFDNLGVITIDPTTDEITAKLVSAEEYTEEDETVKAVVDAWIAEFEELLNEVVATTEVTLAAYDPETGDRLVRTQETNLGDLCADAYRTILDADIALINGGGIRADIEIGDITYADIIAVQPFGNMATSIEVSGQVILDALEMGSSASPEENSAFLHVSGMTYTIDTTIESSLVVDESGCFVSVDGEYRVTDVMIGDEPLDLEKMYVVAGYDYMLLSYGDGLTMFKDAEVVRSEVMIDNEVLIDYITDELGGVVGEEYSNINGEGRITILTEESKLEDEEGDSEEDSEGGLEDGSEGGSEGESEDGQSGLDEEESDSEDGASDSEDGELEDGSVEDGSVEDESVEEDVESAPETGDYAPIGVLVFLLVASVGCGGFLVVRKRKNRK